MGCEDVLALGGEAHEVAFPVPGCCAIIGGFWSFVDGDAVFDGGL